VTKQTGSYQTAAEIWAGNREDGGEDPDSIQRMAKKESFKEIDKTKLVGFIHLRNWIWPGLAS